jgi:hypothetical protein
MLYQLSYASEPITLAAIWSRKRESNPQPAAWKIAHGLKIENICEFSTVLHFALT